MPDFDSVLVANRGEIAVRVLRSAAAAGYRTIAVYSEADARAPHVALADEAVLIGPAPVGESYLDPERILAAAARTGATAIHPGYGFLSENAAFARRCAEQGIVFIGPAPESIELMGNKAAAKRRMLAAGVPCVPGYHGADQSDEALLAAAAELGVPLMVKAAEGGGGRGMRFVQDQAELPAALAAARSEAQHAFGSAELILERAVLQPRHVEIQVFGDGHGNVIHLGERDCSVQRRHQKVVEEAPCPVVDTALREAMGAAAVAAARSIDYVGAGTVEFLLGADGRFYFLEMNTRLQVEHPVTECVTGLDLVSWQLQVARGGALPMTQDELRIEGHAIEVRLYAEDTTRDFLPATGRALRWTPPCGEGIRVDHGLLTGLEISPFYDPMVAKIIASGPDRDTARRRLLRALEQTVLFGVESNRQFLCEVLRRPSFIRGEATTAFIAQEFPDGVLPLPMDEELLCLGALLIHRQACDAARSQRLAAAVTETGLRSDGLRPTRFRFDAGAGTRDVSLRGSGSSVCVASIDGARYELNVLAEGPDGSLRVAVDGLQGTLIGDSAGPGRVALQWRGRSIVLADQLVSAATEATAGGSGQVLAPMHGNLLATRVAVGERVEVGMELAVMEAMKMEHRLLAQIDGVVRAVHAEAGQQLAAGALVMEIEVA